MRFDLFLVLTTVIFFTSCTFSVPQAESLFAVFVKKPASSDPGFDRTFMWTARLGQEGRLVRLYDGGPHGFIFAAEEGDIISFDGWVIRSVKGFGLEGARSVADDSKERTYASPGRSETSTFCSDWTRTYIEEMAHWHQQCAGLPTHNVIVVDAAGNVVSIRQAIEASGNQLILDKL